MDKVATGRLQSIGSQRVGPKRSDLPGMQQFSHLRNFLFQLRYFSAFSFYSTCSVSMIWGEAVICGGYKGLSLCASSLYSLCVPSDLGKELDWTWTSVWWHEQKSHSVLVAITLIGIGASDGGDSVEARCEIIGHPRHIRGGGKSQAVGTKVLRLGSELIQFPSAVRSPSQHWHPHPRGG